MTTSFDEILKKTIEEYVRQIEDKLTKEDIEAIIASIEDAIDKKMEERMVELDKVITERISKEVKKHLVFLASYIIKTFENEEV